MPVRGLPPSSTLPPSAHALPGTLPTPSPIVPGALPTITTTHPSASNFTMVTQPDGGIGWSASWTELPRSHVASTTGGFGLADRAVLGVVLGATTLTAGAAFAAPPTTLSYSIDTGEAASTAHLMLFSMDAATDFTPLVVADAAPAALALGLGLSSAVGPGKSNKPADVMKVQERLAARGYPIDADGAYGSKTDRAIRVYEAMITGQSEISNTTGIITPGGRVDRALASPHGPRWVEMPAGGAGFMRIDHDGFSHGSSLAADTIVAAGAKYEEAYRGARPGKSLIAINDVSRKLGGPNADHETHEAGLDIDVSLPTVSGGHSTRVGWSSYDREATYAMIRAFAEDPRVERILFTDAVLLARIAESDVPWKDKVMDGGPVHRNHFHVDIAPWSPPATTASPA